MALLRAGDLSVTEVCFAVGFSSLGSFSTQFRRYVGDSPSTYRQRDGHADLAKVPSCYVRMFTRPHVYEDQWGQIIDRPAADLVELRWYDSTESMPAPDFRAWLLIFADYVQRLRRRCLSDLLHPTARSADVPARWATVGPESAQDPPTFSGSARLAHRITSNPNR